MWLEMHEWGKQAGTGSRRRWVVAGRAGDVKTGQILGEQELWEVLSRDGRDRLGCSQAPSHCAWGEKVEAGRPQRRGGSDDAEPRWRQWRGGEYVRGEARGRSVSEQASMLQCSLGVSSSAVWREPGPLKEEATHGLQPPAEEGGISRGTAYARAGT